MVFWESHEAACARVRVSRSVDPLDQSGNGNIKKRDHSAIKLRAHAHAEQGHQQLRLEPLFAHERCQDEVECRTRLARRYCEMSAFIGAIS